MAVLGLGERRTRHHNVYKKKKIIITISCAVFCVFRRTHISDVMGTLICELIKRSDRYPEQPCLRTCGRCDENQPRHKRSVEAEDARNGGAVWTSRETMGNKTTGQDITIIQEKKPR